MCGWNTFLCKCMWDDWITHRQVFDANDVLLKRRYVFMEIRNILFVRPVRPSHWYLRWHIYDIPTNKLGMFWVVRNAYRCASEDTEFYTVEFRLKFSKTCSSRHSQISLKIFCSAFLSLCVINRRIDFVFQCLVNFSWKYAKVHRNFPTSKWTEPQLNISGWPSHHLQQLCTKHPLRRFWIVCWIQRCCHWMGKNYSKPILYILCRKAADILPEHNKMNCRILLNFH